MSARPRDQKAPAACPRCGAAFACGAEGGACWCAELRPLPADRIRNGEGCLCRACLEEAQDAGPERPARGALRT